MTPNEILEMKLGDVLLQVIRNYMDGDGPSVTIGGENRAQMPWCIVIAITQTSIRDLAEAVMASRGLRAMTIGEVDALLGGKEETTH